VPDPVYEIPAAEFFACYEAWCRAMEYKPVSQTLFGKELSKRGIRPEKRGITYRLGRKWNNSAIDWNWQPPYDGEPS
jgi:phage/plasmid-associated DNA primase